MGWGSCRDGGRHQQLLGGDRGVLAACAGVCLPPGVVHHGAGLGGGYTDGEMQRLKENFCLSPSKYAVLVRLAAWSEPLVSPSPLSSPSPTSLSSLSTRHGQEMPHVSITIYSLTLVGRALKAIKILRFVRM